MPETKSASMSSFYPFRSQCESASLRHSSLRIRRRDIRNIPIGRSISAFFTGLVERFITIGCQPDDFSGTYVVTEFVSEVREAACFGRYGVAVISPSDEDRRTTVFVASGDNALLGE